MTRHTSSTQGAARQADVEKLQLLVHDLVDEFTTTARYEWRPTRRTPGFDRKVPGPDGEMVWENPLPTAAQRRRAHRTQDPGLLEQLRRGGQVVGRRRAVARPDGLGYPFELGYRSYVVDASPLVADMAPTPGAGTNSGGGHRKPTSRPPAGLHQVEALVDITAAIAHSRARLRQACGRGRGRVEPAPVMLHELLDLVVRRDNEGRWLVSDRELRRLVSDARSWASTARLALRYDEPVVELTGAQCPLCGGALRVRRDASSDVWCSGVPGRARPGPALVGEPWPVPDRGCGATWSRLGWIDLLDGQEAG